MCVAFFFEGEDGIRVLVRSRGLGDVYMRHVVHFEGLAHDFGGQGQHFGGQGQHFGGQGQHCFSLLVLPTKHSVYTSS